MQIYNVCLKGAILSKQSYIEKLSVKLRVTHSVEFVHLMKQKTGTTFIGEKIVLKGVVMI